ncbi:MAG: TetR family transcriptional regulator [Chloroflexi bacterium]|nr:TetR family transcriptional regulator [Chloroflexota bacterium]
MRSQTRTIERHERILEAALDVFTRSGFQDAVVDDIADAASTSKGGLYFHFPGKDALFLAVLDRTAMLLRSRLELALAMEAEPLARLETTLRALLQTFGAHRKAARLFLIDTPGAGPRFHRRMMTLRAEFTGLIVAELENAVAAGVIAPVDCRVAAQVWFGGIHEIVSQWALAEDPEDLLARLPALRALLLRSVGTAA